MHLIEDLKWRLSSSLDCHWLIFFLRYHPATLNLEDKSLGGLLNYFRSSHFICFLYSYSLKNMNRKDSTGQDVGWAAQDTWPQFKSGTLQLWRAEVYTMPAITTVEISFVSIENLEAPNFSAIFYAPAQKSLCVAFWKIKYFPVLFLLTTSQLSFILFPVKSQKLLQRDLRELKSFRACHAHSLLDKAFRKWKELII